VITMTAELMTPDLGIRDLMVDDRTAEQMAADEFVARPRPADAESRRVWAVAAAVCDPELPVLTIEDLGVLREASVVRGVAQVSITPTYTGCPAISAMATDVKAALVAAGYPDAVVHTVYAPAWTSDWISEEGKRKLEEFGIAPPVARAGVCPIRAAISVQCPQCGSRNTRQQSRFGAAPCRALYVCQDCLEPFDYFKVH
jgi:ring-1,2-phenylacetyl-CoA epoxidase subunit PaaD